MSTKAYIEANEMMTDKCKNAVTDLYLKGINHDGHSWNTFSDIEECLTIVANEMYEKGRADECERIKSLAHCRYFGDCTASKDVCEHCGDYVINCKEVVEE